jgi:methylthioribose-1-phosphate isomerase
VIGADLRDEPWYVALPREAEMNIDGVHHRTVRLDPNGTLFLINQPLLPHRFEFLETRTAEQTAHAITTMVTRGAGAIGATGAAGMAQAALNAADEGFFQTLAEKAEVLRNTRPTAQNLFYGINAVLQAIEGERDHLGRARQAAVHAAIAVADEDANGCEAIGQHGKHLLEDGFRVSTHCNAGWLAFVDWGSALSPVYAAHRDGKKITVWVDETRPRSQGARLTAFELGQEGVDHAVLVDGALGWMMGRGEVDCVIVGSDRIAANGDVANKIGTSMSALAARFHGVPFYVAAPTTTIDHDCPSGDQIPIEERDEKEVTFTWGWSDNGEFTRVRTTPKGTRARNPAFDVTPRAHVAGIITEKGVIEASPEGIASVR